MNEPVLSIEDLRVALPAWSDRPLAVDGVSLTINRNEILCVVKDHPKRAAGSPERRTSGSASRKAGASTVRAGGSIWCKRRMPT